MMQRLRLHRRAGQLIARLAGWRVIVSERLPRRCVVIGAPHTSGWDLAATLLLMLTGGLRLRWVAKEALFRGPGGFILRALGGIPVRREARAGFVAQMVAAFATEQQLMLAILPEGTRGKAAHWKQGFYHIALGAGVPIVLGYADYERKLIGLGPIVKPSGDIQADFAIIRRFYAGIKGKHPERQGPVAILVGQDLGQGGKA
jgi:1-acyl-sn-glycerol-3-phosphate acyltransferase